MQRDVIGDLGRDLGGEMARELDLVRANSPAVSRARAAFVTGAPSRLRRARRIAPRAYAAGAALLVAAAVLIFFSFRSGKVAPVTFTPLSFTLEHADSKSEMGSAGALVVAKTELPLAFSDGTRLTLRPDAKVRVTDVDHRGARIILESGALHASVIHRADTRWNVDAGPYEVHVTGTQFVVAWDPAHQTVDVALEEGSVVVSGCNANQTHSVRAGESLHLVCGSPETVASAATPASSATSSLGGVSIASLPPAPSAPIAQGTAHHDPSPSSSQVTHMSAPDGTDRAAFDDALATAPISDLLAWSDESRYAGALDRAIEELTAVRRRAPGSDQAATAAFDLGRISFDGKADFSRAAWGFDTYLRERPHGKLAREALGRSLESHQRAGDADRARAEATDYLAKYPSGPHATLAHRILGDHGDTQRGDAP